MPGGSKEEFEGEETLLSHNFLFNRLNKIWINKNKQLVYRHYAVISTFFTKMNRMPDPFFPFFGACRGRDVIEEVEFQAFSFWNAGWFA